MAFFGKSLFAQKTPVDVPVDLDEESYAPSEPLKRVLRARYLPGVQELQKQKEIAELSIGCFEKAKQAIESIRPLIHEARRICYTALKSESLEKKERLADRYGTLREQIDRIATEASYRSVNLVDGSDVKLCLDTSHHYKAGFNILNINLTSGRSGLGLPPVRFFFEEDMEPRDIIEYTEQADRYLDWASDLLCKEAQLIAVRLAETISLARNAP